MILTFHAGRTGRGPSPGRSGAEAAEVDGPTGKREGYQVVPVGLARVSCPATPYTSERSLREYHTPRSA